MLQVIGDPLEGFEHSGHMSGLAFLKGHTSLAAVLRTDCWEQRGQQGNHSEAAAVI